MWYKIKKAIGNWMGNILLYPYPMFIMFCYKSYKIKGNDIRNILNTIKTGDIILRRYDNYLTSKLIPGYFKHSGIYTNDNKVIHMLGDGISKEDILTFTRCDDIAIIHCKIEQISNMAVKKAEEYFSKGVGYDFNFDFKDKSKMSCTEFVNEIFLNPSMKKKNDEYIIPDDFLTLDKSIFEISYRKG